MTRVPRLRVGRLLRRFLGAWAGHFMVPSALLATAVLCMPATWLAVSAFVVLSGLQVSAAQRLLSCTPVADELALWRFRDRAVLVVASLVWLGVLLLVVGLLLVPVSVVAGDWVLWAGPALALIYCALRFWPVWVMGYLYRGPWAAAAPDRATERWHDLSTAWQLTAVPGATWRAGLPVLGCAVLGVALHDAVLAAEVTPGVVAAFDAVLLVSLAPFANLLAVERARRLALCVASGRRKAAGASRNGRAEARG